ncbi:MAG TPA: SRPBCC family protein [Polyangiaceae bacterium]|nr:SRPBCC family protein [Polyangiaceae bacterium]
MSSETDRIEKRIVLQAPIERVWRAVSDSREFGQWFGVELEGPFVENQRLSGKVVPTKVDAEVAKSQEPYAGTTFELEVERIEAPRRIAFRWHPFAVERDVDYSSEPTTLIVFELEQQGKATVLTITESGFDRIPLARRVKAFAMNQQGWAVQAKLIEKYLADGA